MAHHNLLGKKGEALAAEFLRENGFQIIELNWRFSHLEVDIICRHHNTIIFAEVKTRKLQSSQKAMDLISRAKHSRLVNAADIYLLMNCITENARFDLIFILWDEKSENHIIEHIEDAFSAWG